MYLPEEAIRQLGGMGAHWTPRLELTEDRHLLVVLRPGGPSSVHPHRNSLRPGRIATTRPLDAFPGAPLFGPVESTSWRREGDEMSVLLPLAERLPSPTVRSPRMPRPVAERSSRRPVALPVAAVEQPHARLRSLLVSLNELLASGEVDDVELTARNMLAERGGTVKIGGPIRGQRIEEFG